MYKYIIFGAVVIALIISSWFLFWNDSITEDKIQDQSESQIKVTENSNKEVNNINSGDKQEIKKEMTKATLHTNKGDISFEFFEQDSPNTVANFIKLAGSGFYDGVKFHRVIKGFMIQGGDPLSRDNSKMDLWGTGGPGYKFADEIDARVDLYSKVGYKKGIVAMANSGPNTNGSQFFIMAQDYPLPPLYTIFGKVVLGQDVVAKIENTPTGSNDRPTEAVVINSITLE